MAKVTYYVTLPFLRAEDGSLTPGEGMECRTGSDTPRSRLTARQRAQGFISAAMAATG